jgi:hypothetical protein
MWAQLARLPRPSSPSVTTIFSNSNRVLLYCGPQVLKLACQSIKGKGQAPYSRDLSVHISERDQSETTDDGNAGRGEEKFTKQFLKILVNALALYLTEGGKLLTVHILDPLGEVNLDHS